MNNLGCSVYFVPTPIGNLGDITYRGVSVLKEVDVIFTEDTRKSLVLLGHYDIRRPLRSFHKDNEKKVIPEIISLVGEKKVIAIISEAGTPCISDPGENLVKELISLNIKFTVLPGANAVLPAVVMAGFDMKNFYFYGFISHKKGEKICEIERLKNIEGSIILYESPHRVEDTVEIILKTFRRVCLVREISKIYEESVVIEQSSDLEKVNYRGEFVIVIDNRNVEPKENLIEKSPDEIVKNLMNESFSSKDIIKIMKVLGYKRNDVYKQIQNLS